MLTHDQRRQELRHYAKRFDLHTFIETGTNLGHTVDYLINDFDLIYTIEIDPVLFAAADNRFAFAPHVVCLEGDSGSLLPNLVEGLTEPALFWLDGHYCGGDYKPVKDTPIVAEVNSILMAPTGSVVLIDDARLFGGGEDHTDEFYEYPSQTWVELMAELGGYDYTLLDDIFRLTPK